MRAASIADSCLRALYTHGAEVTLRWQTVTSGTLDPTTGAMVGGIVLEHSGTSRAFLHTVSPATSELRMHEEVEIGDVIIDFPPDVDLSGKEALRFDIGGDTYVQKRVGGPATRHFDVLSTPGGTGATFRTVLARKAT